MRQSGFCRVYAAGPPCIECDLDNQAAKLIGSYAICYSFVDMCR